MKVEYTLSMIKPGAVKDQHTGEILAIIEKEGFEIVALKKTRFTKELAQRFYAVHKEKPFFNSLVDYMISGAIYALILKKQNAVADFRKLIGSTNPAEADSGTIRKEFANSLQDNAIHGSDSDENASIESNFFFSETERF